MKKYMIVEKDDSDCKMIMDHLNNEGTFKRAENYAKGIELLKTDIFDHVICNIDLTDTNCFSFMSTVKELDYNHPKLMIAKNDIIRKIIRSDDPDLNECVDYINQNDVQEKIDKVLKVEPGKNKLEEFYTFGQYRLEITPDNSFDTSKVFIFDLDKKFIILGVNDEYETDRLKGSMHLKACFPKEKRDLVLVGKVTNTQKFDENFGTKYLKFTLSEGSCEIWESVLDAYEKENIDVADLLLSIRSC